MRASTREREQFIADLLKHVPTATEAHARKLLRWGAIYARLCEAECNGDYPYRPGTERNNCMMRECGNRFEGRGEECPSCRAERIIRETCRDISVITREGRSVEPVFQGDPRGHTVRLQIAGQPLDAFERPALAVPTS